MILTTLYDLYDQMAADPANGLPVPGYSVQKISFCVVIEVDGTFHAIQDARDTITEVTPKGGTKTKAIARQVLVPGSAKPPGSGINPCLLWDNTTYLLGYKSDDPKPERTVKSWEAFRDRHLALEKEIKAPGFTALCRFLEQWSPEKAMEQKALLDDFAATGFGVFRLQGSKDWLHNDPAIKSWWNSHERKQVKNGTTGQCLITGEMTALALLHEPAIKGVKDAQQGGAKLVSFNATAFTSYGMEQSLNAPVSEAAAFRYTNALNTLLTGPISTRHRIQIGDATTVFWTARPSNTLDFLADFIDGKANETDEAQDAGLLQSLRAFLGILRNGGGTLAQLGDEETTPFYLLGLSPNASRLSVRTWHVSTLGAMVQHLRQHYQDMALVRSERDPEFPPIWQLLRQTARESKDIPPLLSGPLLRAILGGGPYPQGLYGAVLNRIRADHEISYLRCCILKATLTRLPNNPHHIPMSLDPNRPDPAYLVGRLFAVLERTQEDALGRDLNATIRDRFYSAASATPATVMPRLLRTYQHHLTKATAVIAEKKGRDYARGYRTNQEKLMQEIHDNLTDMPRHLGLEDQGLFAIGYYHQRQAFFTKAPETPAS
jgi:CRISPR-associated protein Csd1